MYQLPKKVQEAIERHAEETAPVECCGLVAVVNGRRRYFPCKNLSTEADTFHLDPADFARVSDLGEVVAVAHSHPNSYPQPSEADRTSCEVSGLPWVIYSPHLQLWGGCEPEGYQAPLVGREYAYRVLDCFTLVTDYYRQHGVKLLPWERPAEEVWDANPADFQDHWRDHGFIPAEGDIREGDGLLLSIGRTDGMANHVGVYVGDQRFLHHLQNRLSSIDIYSGFWQDATALVLRHPGWRA